MSGASGTGQTICLFDWGDGGHNRLYMRRAAEALIGVAQVVIAASEPVLQNLVDLPASMHSLGEPRPLPGGEHSNAELAGREIALLRSTLEQVDPDRALHLHADAVLRWLNAEPPLPAPLAIMIHNAWAHYPDAFGDSLSLRWRLRGAYVERKVRRWRRRADAHSVLALDPVAAERWARLPGAPARWLPEPGVDTPGLAGAGKPRGCVLFGAINERKGVDLFADAIALAPTEIEVRIAGFCLPGYESELARCVQQMRDAGATVEPPGPSRPSDREAMGVLANARCAVLPYRWHPGTSRVMTEAAAVGTPVVGPREGLAGHYISEWGLGLKADPTRPRELREATLRLAGDPDARARYAPALRRYTAEVGGDHFERALRELFGLPIDG